MSGNTLASGITASSITSLGTLGSLSVTNNITVGGNVDGRDVSADGSKLDGIESGATADQSASEIRSLVNSASDSNVFTDADHSKLNGIASSANNYTHPSHPGDDFSIDTGHLSGATVIDDLDINVTTDGSGHVTDCNATVGTRNLTLGNLGFTGATNANYITNTNQLTNGAGFITSALTGNSKVTIKTSGSGTHTTQSWCKIMVAAFVGGGGGGGSSSAYHDDDDPSTYGAGGAGGTGGVKFKVATPNGASGYSYSVGGGGGTAGGGGNTSFGGSTAGGGGGGSNAGSSGNAGGGSGGSGDIPGRSGGTGKSNNKNQYSPFWGAYGSNGYGRYGTENGPTSGVGGCIIILELG